MSAADDSVAVLYWVPHAPPDRMLASVRRVHSVTPHPNADHLSVVKLSVVGVLDTPCGSQVVVHSERTAYRPGDCVLYVEDGAVLPLHRPEFEFMRARFKGRVRTLRLRGELSHGLIFPVRLIRGQLLFEGDDVTDALWLQKYVPAEERERYTLSDHRGTTAPFPSHLCRRRKETRVQNVAWARWGAAAKDVVFTEKLRGTSATYVFDAQGQLTHVCSRNRTHVVEDDSIWWCVARELRAVLLLHRQTRTQFLTRCPVVIQGEICGPRIAGNPYGLPQPVFYVCSSSDQFVRHPADVTQRLAFLLGQPTVPVVADHVDLTGVAVPDLLLRYAQGPSLLNPARPREGVIGRSRVDGAAHYAFQALNPAVPNHPPNTSSATIGSA